MVPIRLETENGELVSGDECILPFRKLPKVIVWGVRHFVLHDHARLPVYCECFFYHITGQEKEMKKQHDRTCSESNE